MLNDLNHWWSEDLSAGNTGDLSTVNSTVRGQQRILRRLLTNPGDYMFQPNYGAGLPGWIGATMDIGKVTALIREHILLEDAVAKVPAPQIKVTQTSSDLTAFAVSIAYNDAQTNTPTVLSFNVSQ